MKLINHQKGNYTYDDTRDGSVMYGTIYMTGAQFHESIKALKRAYTRAVRDCNTSIRDGLSHVFNHTLVKHADARRICLGVTATSLLALKWNLPRYKSNQNYVIEIKY